MSVQVKLAALAAVMGSTLAVSGAMGQSTADLAAEVKALRAEVEALRAQRGPSTAPAVVGAPTSEAVAQDAAGRSKGISTDITSGNKNGKFFIQSADGNFSLSPNIQIQVRNTTNINDTGDGWETENGFELRRTKFGAAGNVWSKDLTYDFLVDIPRNSGTATLQFAWLKYKFAPDWAVRLGQFKDPLGKEQLNSGARQLAAERSLLSDLLIGGDDPVQGINLIYQPTEGPLRGEVAFTDGTNQNNTNFRDVNGTTPDTRPEWGAAARVEFQAIGTKFAGYDDFTALKQKETLLVFGAAADITQTGNSNLLTYTADAQFENADGLGAFAAVIGRYTTDFDTDASAATEDLEDVNDIGVVVQASQLVGKWAKADWELFGRYSYTHLADERVTDPDLDNEIHEITVGTNAYFQGHNVKGTLDFSYLPNGSPVTSDGNGVIAGEDAQFVLRAQFQLLI